MKKTHIRDYATDAFRFYARVGGSIPFRVNIWDTALEARPDDPPGDGLGSPTEAAIGRAERALDDAKAALDDLEAVERTLAILEERQAGKEITRALQLVYMAEPDREPIKGEISSRVVHASCHLHADDRTIYRWLGTARTIFAAERGLRL